MPETSTPTLIPDGTTKFPAFQNNNPGNVEVDALKAYILSQAGLANGLATLDENGKLNSSQIPVNLDDVLVYPSYASLPATGETGKLYITSDVNGTYYWNGTSYQILNQSFVRYRGSLSSLPSDPQPGDWFIAASSFSSYTLGHIYLYNGSSWDDVTAVFGQFVLKTDIAQTLGQQIDKVPSNKAVDDAINAIITSSAGTITPESDVSFAYGFLYKKNDLLFFSINGYTSFTAETARLVGIFQSGFRPLKMVMGAGVDTDINGRNLGVVKFYVEENGELYVESAYNGTRYFNINGAFVVS